MTQLLLKMSASQARETFLPNAEKIHPREVGYAMLF